MTAQRPKSSRYHAENSGHRAKINETQRPVRPNKNNTCNNLAITCGVHLVSSQRRFARSCDPLSLAVAVIACLNKYELLWWGFYLHAHLCLSLRLCLLCWLPPSCPGTFRLDLKSSKHLRKNVVSVSNMFMFDLLFGESKKIKKILNAEQRPGFIRIAIVLLDPIFQRKKKLVVSRLVRLFDIHEILVVF